MSRKKLSRIRTPISLRALEINAPETHEVSFIERKPQLHAYLRHVFNGNFGSTVKLAYNPTSEFKSSTVYP